MTAMSQDRKPDGAFASLDNFAEGKLADLESRGLRRELASSKRAHGAKVLRNGRELISFTCNDFLALSHHPDVLASAKEAIDTHGAGAGASRLQTGSHPFYAELERRLARIKGTEAAIVFGSGYLANIGIIPSLIGPDDLILADELAHACIHAGNRLSRAKVALFRHNDAADCRAILERQRRNHPRCMIVTEGVFSMDGDRAPLPDLSNIADEFDAWLMVDDAHAFGVLGRGRGSAAHWPVPVRVPLQMGTLSKAVGAYGGYLCASKAVVDCVVNRARSLIYTTALPPMVVAAAIAALDVIEKEPHLCEIPLERARLFTSLLGTPAAESCIVPLILGDADTVMKAADNLADKGFLVTPIRPPTVPEGASRLRLTFCADHKESDVADLAQAIRALEGVS
jgi:8-amino-7-oxononanoate synthase